MLLKRINKWYCFFLMSVVLFSCSADDTFREKDKEIEESSETVRVSFSVSAAEMDLVGDPLPAGNTRAAVDDSHINSAYMFQFNGTADTSTLLKSASAISMSNNKLVFDLGLDASATANRVYLVANVAGITLPTVDASTTLAAFKAMLLPFTDATIRNANAQFNDGLFMGGIPMIGYKDITPNTPTESDLSFSLERIAAKITVTINTSLSDFVPYSVQLKNVALKGQYTAPAAGAFPDNAASTNFADYALAYCGSLRTFTWYVPENRRGTVGTIQYATAKGPSNAPAYSTYIEVLGSIASQGLAYYRIYPGANATTDFDIVRNTHYNLSVNVAGMNYFDDRIEKPVVNCYVLTPGSTISIPVTRAFTPGGAPEGSTFTLTKLWDDTSGGAVADYSISGSGASAVITVTAGTLAGNAVIAAKVGDITYWSWHIWVTNYNPWKDGTITNAYNTNNKGANFVFMDRNLGATQVASLATPSGIGTGLFYQWGRKDPFPATKSYDEAQDGFGKFTRILVTDIADNGSTVEYGYRNPEKFIYAPNSPYDWYNSGDAAPEARKNDLWGHNSSKTVYDPCPVGWRVPSHYGVNYASPATSPWAGFATGGNVHIDSQVFNKGYTWGVNIYPAAGARSYGSGSLVNLGTSGNYWSASPFGSTSVDASRLNFNSGYVNVNNYISRADGLSVRCVRE